MNTIDTSKITSVVISVVPNVKDQQLDVTTTRVAMYAVLSSAVATEQADDSVGVIFGCR